MQIGPTAISSWSCSAANEWPTDTARREPIISRALMRYDPRFGYTYMPGLKSRVPGPDGGYLIHTNQLGFRSEREFAERPTPSAVRALLFGDSQTAGDG